MDTIDLSTKGKRIRFARMSAGFPTAIRFADEIEVTPVTLSRYENGHIDPSSDVLLRIAKKSGRSMYWLMTGEEQPEAAPDSAPAPEAA
jgi:transcriptional regulator with XRE-family HTH domain